QQLKAILQERGVLPLEHETQTPGEIAVSVSRAIGDSRVHRLVWEFYYPRHFGNQAGSLTDDEALQLVKSIRTRAASEVEQGRLNSMVDFAECGVCHRRPAGRGG